MKEEELRNRATCNICGNKLGAAVVPMFAVVKVQRYIIDMQALNRKAGLEMFMGGGPGGVALAGILGPNDDLAKVAGDEMDMTICFSCLDEQTSINALVEAHIEASIDDDEDDDGDGDEQ